MVVAVVLVRGCQDPDFGINFVESPDGNKMLIDSEEGAIHLSSNFASLINCVKNQWLVPSKLLVNQPVEKLQGSNSPPKLQESPHPQPVESRSPTVTVLELLLSVKFASTKRARSC
ncbi:unnamed protein product [Fraxinus pennsylvanica]|uniref:Uncharacterized protein n=1 Tax=Fraxinus pennsylvanica TaxID=56036 RepID=A0AAD1YQY0_9LAMI|nr:unnamed protein product [Fraxinus pennsylvanica]